MDDKQLKSLPGIGADLAGKLADLDQNRGLQGPSRSDRKDPARPDRVAAPARPGSQAGADAQREAAHQGRQGSQAGDRSRRAAHRARLRPQDGNATGEALAEEKPSRRAAPDVRRGGAVGACSAAPICAMSRAVEQVEVAGSFRRRKETVGDLDLLAISTAPAAVMDHFARFSRNREGAGQGRDQIQRRAERRVAG